MYAKYLKDNYPSEDPKELKQIRIVDGKAVIADKPAPPTSEEMLEMVKENISPENILKNKGYTIIRKLGEGCTRDVYEVEYKNGALVKRRVAKIPKSTLDETSVTTLINLSKGDLNEREIIALNRITHPNIIEIVDTFPVYDSETGKRMTATIEEYYDAVSLEELIEMSGPIKDSARFKHIFSQIIAGLRHLNESERLLHRDIKPSNILIGKQDNFVKIADLQNAGSIDNIVDGFLPTRGGTAYTDPHMLNALMSGRETCASMDSEVYALGMTMFYALAGETLLDAKLIRNENSARKINIRGDNIGITLTAGGKETSRITPEEHDRILEIKLRKVPRQYRKLLRNCLSMRTRKYSNSPFEAYISLRHDFERATASRFIDRIDWDMVWKHSVGYTIGAAVLTGLLAGSKLIQLQDRNEAYHQPTVYEMLLDRSFGAGLDVMVKDGTGQVEQLIPTFKEIKENYEQMDSDFSKILQIDTSCDIQRMSKRMSYSLFRSILMQNSGRAYGSKASMIEQEKMPPFETERYKCSLVPFAFIINDMRRMGYRDYAFLDSRQTFNSGIRYLKTCIGSNSSLADIYALYFADTGEEIFEARQKADNFSYFPASKDGKTKPGYGSFLHPIKKELIDRALALYAITDGAGDVHLEMLDSNNKPISGLEAK